MEKKLTHKNLCSATKQIKIKAIKWNFMDITVVTVIIFYLVFMQFKKANLCVFSFITLLSDKPIDIILCIDFYFFVN